MYLLTLPSLALLGLIPLSPTDALLRLISLTPTDSITLVHAPAQDSMTLGFETELIFDGGDLVVVMDGAEVPQEYLPDLHMQSEERKVLRVVETYGARAEEEAAGSWLRLYEEIAWDNDGEMSIAGMQGESGFPWSAQADSPLVGRQLSIDTEDGEEFEVSVVDDEGDLDVPDGLHADLSLRQLLPEDSVSLGESWTVSGKGLGVLFDPGGDLAWDMAAESAAYLMPEIRERNHGGVLELTVDRLEGASAHCSVTGELIRVTVQPGDLSPVPVVDGTATDTVEERWELEGQLVWDIDAKRITSLSLSGPLSSETKTVRDPGQPGSTYEGTFTVEGTYAVEVECVPEGAQAVEASSSGQ